MKLIRLFSITLILILAKQVLAQAGLSADALKKILPTQEASKVDFFMALGWTFQKGSQSGLDPKKSLVILSAQDLGTSAKLRLVLKSMAKAPVQKERFQKLYASKIRELMPQMSQMITWPQSESIDALGDGWEKEFKRTQRQVSLASWSLLPNLSPSQAMKQMLSSTRSAGCGVALNSYRHMAYYQTFNNPGAFDLAAQGKLLLNNEKFYPSPLFPQFKQEHQAKKWAARGAQSLIGHSGYLNALFEDVEEGGEDVNVISEAHYAGENFMITDMSPAAVKQLAVEGLGYYFDPEDVATEIDDLDQVEGLSLRLVEWWDVFQKAYEKSGEDSALALEKVKQNKKAKALLEVPFFTETVVWGHPIGSKPLIEWVYELASVNPLTPYGIFFYDYGEDQVLWNRYLDSHGLN